MRLKMISHRDALAFVRDKYGSEGLSTLLSRLSEQDREIATSYVGMVGSWVDLDVHLRLLARIVSDLGGGDEGILRAMGEWIATSQLTGVYRVFLLVVSPEFMLRRSSIVFHTFYDEGELQVVTLGPGRVDCTFKGFTKEQRIIELAITGWFTGAAKLSRARNSRLDITTSLAEGKGYFRVLFAYDA